MSSLFYSQSKYHLLIKLIAKFNLVAIFLLFYFIVSQFFFRERSWKRFFWLPLHSASATWKRCSLLGEELYNLLPSIQSDPSGINSKYLAANPAPLQSLANTCALSGVRPIWTATTVNSVWDKKVGRRGLSGLILGGLNQASIGIKGRRWCISHRVHRFFPTELSSGCTIEPEDVKETYTCRLTACLSDRSHPGCVIYTSAETRTY